MRNTSASIYKVVLGIVLCGMLLSLTGCRFMTQPGETAAEGHRRHIRNVRINQQEMIRDIDKVLLMDEPSRSMDRRLPPEMD
ncbi:MAG: hypothetical protein KAS75_02910 [Planctomycetes bacterium]|nr:hypothetical protein [Planctomycetota bacterium]